MTRITVKDLEGVVSRLNRLTDNPDTTWTRNAEGKLKANIGNYHLSGAYGGYALHQNMSDGRGITDIFNGHMPKRELYNLIHAYLNGIDAK
tara:strand:- start:366 stop:638 length:273 start_codon:yes stop_codon:yes gene_type:complete